MIRLEVCSVLDAQCVLRIEKLHSVCSINE